MQCQSTVEGHLMSGLRWRAYAHRRTGQHGMSLLLAVTHLISKPTASPPARARHATACICTCGKRARNSWGGDKNCGEMGKLITARVRFMRAHTSCSAATHPALAAIAVVGIVAMSQRCLQHPTLSTPTHARAEGACSRLHASCPRSCHSMRDRGADGSVGENLVHQAAGRGQGDGRRRG